MDELENIIFEIISNGGNAKGISYEAIACAENGEFDKAYELLKEADESLLKAHKIQTSILQKEASGDHYEVNVLFVHAQDHLMSAMEIRVLAENLIKINKRLFDIEKTIKLD